MHKAKFLIFLLAGILILSANAYSNPRKTTKTFEGKRLIRLKTVAGDCLLKKGNSDKIEVIVANEYQPADSFEPEFRENGDILRMEENLYGSNRGNSLWIITAPDGIEIDFSSASGSINIEGISCFFSASTASGDYEMLDCDGVFDLSTASGNFDINNCKGEFDISTASGSVNARNITLTESGNFSSASGYVKVILGSTPEYDLNIGSASGRAILDYNGLPMKGQFEMTARYKKGRIDTPFEFDNVEKFSKYGDQYIRKSIVKGSENPLITIGTSSGRAILRE